MNLYFCVQWPEDEFEFYMKRVWKFEASEKGYDGKCIAVAQEGSGVIIIIYTRKGNSQPDTLTHECVHAANFIFESRNVRFDYENDEPYAYLVGMIYREALKSVKSLKKRGLKT